MQGIMNMKPPQPFLNLPVCQTEIQLNGTHTMSGEQETPFLPLLPEYIYLGGAPHDMLHVRYLPQPQPSKMCKGTLIWWCLLLVCGVASSASLLGRERWEGYHPKIYLPG